MDKVAAYINSLWPFFKWVFIIILISWGCFLTLTLGGHDFRPHRGLDFILWPIYMISDSMKKHFSSNKPGPCEEEECKQ
jgi:hypothetical protein